MKLEFGIRFSKKSGVSNFGIDEDNAALKEGAIIRELKSEGASFVKTDRSGGFVTLGFVGGVFSVIMDAPGHRRSVASL